MYKRLLQPREKRLSYYVSVFGHRSFRGCWRKFLSAGKVLQVLNDHQHFVQGVAWDPAGEFLTSISSDRTCRIYSRQSVPKSKKRKLAVVQNMFTCKQVLAKSDALPSKTNITIDADGRVAKVMTWQPDWIVHWYFWKCTYLLRKVICCFLLTLVSKRIY